MCVLCVSVFLEDTVCPLGAPLLPVFCSVGKAAPQMTCTIPVLVRSQFYSPQGIQTQLLQEKGACVGEEGVQKEA